MEEEREDSSEILWFLSSFHPWRKKRKRSKVQNPGIINMAVKYIRFKMGKDEKDKQRFCVV